MATHATLPSRGWTIRVLLEVGLFFSIVLGSVLLYATSGRHMIHRTSPEFRTEALANRWLQMNRLQERGTCLTGSIEPKSYQTADRSGWISTFKCQTWKIYPFRLLMFTLPGIVAVLLLVVLGKAPATRGGAPVPAADRRPENDLIEG